MVIGNRLRRAVWLALLAVSAAGGWFFGRGCVESGPPSETERTTRSASPLRNEVVFAAGSPEGGWIAAVKKAGPDDFPRLLEEWKILFPDTVNFLEGRPENALRFLFALWLVKDLDGFLKAATGPELNYYSHWAAQVLVRLKPEKAAELLTGPANRELDEYFANDLARELAKHNPTIYLKINPDGNFEIMPGRHSSGYDDWEIAIIELAKTDAVAAAKACLAWNGNSPRTINRALLAVAEGWKTNDPTFAEWVDEIADAKLRNFATHARLCALAEKDPLAALADMYSVKLAHDSDLDEEAPEVILMQLAKADLVGALKLMKDVEGIFSKYKRDPFDEPSEDEKAEKTANPFSQLSPGRYSGGEEVENNGVRHAVLRAAAENLPDDPIQFFGALHQLSAGMGDGDNAWQRGVEADLICLKSQHWSSDTCLTVAGLWAAELSGARDDPTMKELAERAAHVNLDQALAALDQLPESARPSFASEIIKQLPAVDPDQRIVLFSHLIAEQWNDSLGEALGKNAGDYAPVIASLPAVTTLGARQAFMKQWGDQDPEAAALWLDSLPDDAASQPAAAGLATAWAAYDEDAACAWADSLPAGPAHDGAAASLADSLARHQPDEAWSLASSIADPKTRAEAFFDVACRWRNKAPDEFRAAYAAARQAVGLPVLLQNGTDLFE